MGSLELGLILVVASLLLTFLGYKTVDNHRWFGFVCFMPLRLWGLAPLMSGAMTVADITPSYVVLCASWYMLLSFEIKHCHHIGFTLLAVGFVLNNYGA